MTVMDSIQFKKYYTKVKNFLLSPKNKEFLIFLIFFSVSAVFWLLRYLNETFDVELKVPLKLDNVPPDVVITSDLPSELNVVVRDKGTILARYIYGKKQPPVRVNYEDYDEENSSGHVFVTLLDIQKEVQSHLLSSTHVVSLKPDTLEYFFNKGTSKKVPVKKAGVWEPSQGYYLQKVELKPDSVDVLAPYSILDTLTEACIAPVYLPDLTDNVKTKIKLHPVKGAKFIPDQVEMNISIDRYTEKTVDVPVSGINFPANKDLRTFPSKVKVTFRVGMSQYKDITEDDFVLAISYEELIKNQYPKIRPYPKSIPSGVSNVRINPSEVDYLIEQVREENEE